MRMKNSRKTKVEQYNSEGCENLAKAIVEQAAVDYLEAIRQVRRHPHNALARQIVKECEYFFRNDAELWTDIGGEEIIRAIRAKAVTGEIMKRKKL